MNFNYTAYVQKKDSEFLLPPCSVVFLTHQRYVSLFPDHLQAVLDFTVP